jgi:enoyl-CoA hydratase/carnithine racemase
MTATLLSEKVGRTLVLTISNPSMRNALALEMYPALLGGLADAAGNDAITSVVITGAEGNFCAGGNLNRLRSNRDLPRSVQEGSIDQLHHMIKAVIDCPKPVVAAVEGAAAGAGYSLALACDMLVAAGDAQFLMAYVKVGLSPDGGGSWQVLQVLPRQLAMQQLLTGEALRGNRLAELGVVNRVTEAGDALKEALKLCSAFDRLSPAAVAAAKRLARGASQRTLPEHMELEKASFVDCLFGDEAKEAIDAFLEKRPAQFGLHASI